MVNGSVTATDVDTGATLSFALNGAAPAGLTFNTNGSYSFNPANAAYQSLGVGQQQVITVPYTVTDDNGATSTANLVITVTGTNDAPVANANTGPGDRRHGADHRAGHAAGQRHRRRQRRHADHHQRAGRRQRHRGADRRQHRLHADGQLQRPGLFTYTVSDGSGGSHRDVTVNITAVADAPTLIINGTLDHRRHHHAAEPAAEHRAGARVLRQHRRAEHGNAGNIATVESASRPTATSTSDVTDVVESPTSTSTMPTATPATST